MIDTQPETGTNATRTEARCDSSSMSRRPLCDPETRTISSPGTPRMP